jgi:hypothetical protein
LSPLAPIIGGYSGSLSNTGDRLRLERPDTPPPDDPLVIPYVTVDEVTYDDQTPWPMPVAGDPIIRRASMFFGNDGNLWTHSSTFDLGDNVYGDFNGDDVADAYDIDLLFDAVNRISQNPDFVLSGTRPTADEFEIDFYVRDLLGTEFGDANLDGAVDAIDFGIWSNHKFQPCTGWASADFNGDGKTDVSDFNGWNDHKFLNAAPTQAARPAKTPRQPLPVLQPKSELPGIRNRAVEPEKAGRKRQQTCNEQLISTCPSAMSESITQDGVPVLRHKLSRRGTSTFRSRQTHVERPDIVDHIFTELGSESLRHRGES